MKTTTQFIFCVFFLIITKGTFAQIENSGLIQSSSCEKIPLRVREVMQQQNVHSTAKKNRSSSRLVTRTYHTYDGNVYSLQDSTTYIYCSNYGYDPTYSLCSNDYYNDNNWSDNFNNMYDSSFHYDAGGNLSARKVINFFGVNHKLMRHYEIYNVNAYYCRTHQYDPNEKRTQFIDSSLSQGSISKRMLQYYYNGAGKLNVYKGFMWTGAAWQQNEIDSLFYDGNGNVIGMSVYDYDNVNAVLTLNQTWNGTYNGANNLISSITDYTVNNQMNDIKWENTFDASNRQLTETILEYKGGTWVNKHRTSYAYAAGIYPVVNQSEKWDSLANSWINLYKMDLTYNASNQVETLVNFTWDTLNSVWAVSGKTTFYYQGYFAESLSGIQSLNADIAIYPVPVQDVLNVDVNLSEKQNSEILVLDMTGKQVLKNVYNMSAKYHVVLSTSSLAPGSYLFIIKGEKGVLSRKFAK